MAEHEPPKSKDTTDHRDDAAAASEPMDLQRLPDAKVPPGRQRTGDPPAPRNNVKS